MQRREFIACSATATAGLFLPGISYSNRMTNFYIPTPLDAPLDVLADNAIAVALAGGASYADVRVCRYRNQFIGTREAQVQWTADTESFGFGLRVIADGAWGFASNVAVTPDELKIAAISAVAMARANARLQKEPVALAPTQVHRDTWRTPIGINPFDVPLQEKVDLLLAINREGLRAAGTKFCASSLFQTSEWKFFASSEGARLEQEMFRIWPSYSVTAMSSDGSDFQSCSGTSMPTGRGYEYMKEFPLLEDARRAGENAAEKLGSPMIEPGVRDLVLMPSHLWLVIHESIGHATELDRALGFEANYAGTSFVTPENLNTLRYASDIVNVVGDRTEQHGLATVGYDDDGVKATRFDIIRDGIFTGYQTTREQAAWVGDDQSHSCSYADSYGSVPMQRMPNVSLLPGDAALSPEDLVAGIEEGVLIEGDGSWSIDQQRRNFQFGGQVFRRIHNGRIDGMYRDVAYQAMTLDFWRACDAICSKEHYQLGGSYWCGKAQPSQVAPVSHGSAPSRFRSINFINTGR